MIHVYSGNDQRALCRLCGWRRMLTMCTTRCMPAWSASIERTLDSKVLRDLSEKSKRFGWPKCEIELHEILQASCLLKSFLKSSFMQYSCTASVCNAYQRMNAQFNLLVHRYIVWQCKQTARNSWLARSYLSDRDRYTRLNSSGGCKMLRQNFLRLKVFRKSCLDKRFRPVCLKQKTVLRSLCSSSQKIANIIIYGFCFFLF